MTSILQKIGQEARQRVADYKSRKSLSLLKAEVDSLAFPARDFAKPFRAGSGFSVIAEYKRASPSTGEIAPHLKPVEVASAYLKEGAAALSILTEPKHFMGDLKFIEEIRASHNEALILMKDFFVDEYQLYQARLIGADAILIIVGLLGEKQSQEMHTKAKHLGLSTLVEVHDEDELKIGLDLKPDLLGVNNRDLRDLSIDLATSHRLAKLIPSEQIAISESGIDSYDDLVSLSKSGYCGFLVGSSLMKTGQPGKALAKLIHGAGDED